MRMVLGLDLLDGETLVTVEGDLQHRGHGGTQGRAMNGSGVIFFSTESRSTSKSKSTSKAADGGVLYTGYSRTLSSSFLRPQSAAAWTKARTTGCGFFSVEESWGWNRVAMKKRWVGDSMAGISPWAPRATMGKPASMVAHSYSGLTSKLQKNSSVTTSSSLP